jgi:Uma2 family endonuclease
MSAAALETPVRRTFEDIMNELGGIPAGRIWAYPVPGTATEQDVLAIRARTGRLCELIDGTLVEKAMGLEESTLAIVLAAALLDYVRTHKCGLVAGADAMMRLFPGQVRIPDVSFVSRERVKRMARGPIPDLAPDLAVEVLSLSNTKAEMERKLREYFDAGSRLVWYIDPRARQAWVYTSPERGLLVTEEGRLDGGEVLPGFTAGLGALFAETKSMLASEE